LENREIYLMNGSEVIEFAKEISKLLKDGRDFKPSGQSDCLWGIVLFAEEADSLRKAGALIELVTDSNDPDGFIRSRFVV